MPDTRAATLMPSDASSFDLVYETRAEDQVSTMAQDDSDIITARTNNQVDEDEDEDGSEAIDFAVSLMAESKAELSLANLETAVFLFRQVLNNRPVNQPPHFEAMRDLASALLMRFMHTNQMRDLEESFILRREAMEGALYNLNRFNDADNSDINDVYELARVSLTDLQKSVSLETINTVVFLLRTWLLEHSGPHPRQFLALRTLADALYAQFHHSFDVSVLNEAISSLQDARKCISEREWQQSNMLHSLCSMLALRFDITRDVLDFENVFSGVIGTDIQETGIQTPEGDADILSMLNFANELYDQFNATRNVDCQSMAIALIREAIAGLPVSSDNYAIALGNLAAGLHTRFGALHEQSDLDEAIALNRRVLKLRPPPDPIGSRALSNLATALATQFKKGEKLGDLDEAISLRRQALEFRSPDRPKLLNDLGDALLTRVEHGGLNQQVDLDEAISMFRQALRLLPLRHLNQANFLNNLACALRSQFDERGRESDLDESILLHRLALELRPLPHIDRSMTLNNLANSLNTKAEQGGQQSDLDEAILLYRQALELQPPPHPARARTITHLADALRIQFERSGDQGDLNESISLNRKALEIRPPPHPFGTMALSNLALALQARFLTAGQQSDLDEAISVNREALELRPPPHPHRSKSLNNLAAVLWIRFDQAGQQKDLDEAISLHRQVLELRPHPHPRRSRSLNNLAGALQRRLGLKQGNKKSDLDEAISLYRQAIELHPPPHPQRPVYLGNLGNALLTEEEGCQKNGLDEAISLHREVLESRPITHPHRPMALSNLSDALRIQFMREGGENDLYEAISLTREALDLQSPSHPHHSRSQYDLGTLLMHAYSQTDANSQYLDEAMSLFSSAAQDLSQPASRRLTQAQEWRYHAYKHRHHSVFDACDVALQALHQVAALSSDIQSRQEALKVISDGLARDASRCAIEGGNLEKAIEFLEAGRAVFWSQVLSLRSPLNRLHDIDPGLADKLRNIGMALEAGSHRDQSFQVLDNPRQLMIDKEAARLNRLNEQWLTCVDTVRKLDGFEEFLHPPRLSSLRGAASEHPVIMLVANTDSSHCIIMRASSVHHIAFPRLHTPMLQYLVSLVQVAVSQLTVSLSSTDSIMENLNALPGEEGRGMRFANDPSGSSDDVFKYVLRVLWDEVVKPVIDFLNIEKSEGEIPVLQWCPTGLFTFLPIHAAGCYDNDHQCAMECAADYFISSYTPTIGALLAEHQISHSQSQPFKMMVVIDQQLPSTTRELRKIEQHVSSNVLVKFGIDGAPAGIEAVASHLPDVSIAHFACHGTQDRGQPLNSGLKLGDGLLRVSKIMKGTMKHGSLAFLAACETAMGDEKLPDEAMSLGACLLFSGFRRVVATMWEMSDEDGPTIADAFYEELCRGHDDGESALLLVPDTSRSARALHVAVQKLRSQNVEFRRWVPFIHMGQC